MYEVSTNLYHCGYSHPSITPLLLLVCQIPLLECLTVIAYWPRNDHTTTGRTDLP